MQYRSINSPALVLCSVLGVAGLLATAVDAQETVTYEQGAGGVTYKVTRRVTQQLTPVTEMQQQEQTVYTPQYSTQMQTYQQNVVTPVTEYRWVSRMRGRWNPFIQPYWDQQLEPFTRWESRQQTIQTPTTKTEWVAERRTVQTPVTKYKTVQNETISRVAVSSTPPAVNPTPRTFGPVETPMVATRPLSPIGGHRMQSDPPRAATMFR